MAEIDGTLRQRLTAASSLAACAQLACDHLVARGFPLPSVYLCRSGRLRCFGACGYWQVLDGFPPTAGILAATVRTGTPHQIEVEGNPIYVAAAPSVVAEVCVPILLDGEVVGALNIESTQPLPEHTMAVALVTADLLAERIAQLGGVTEPTGWMFLADQATRIVQIDEPARLFDAALELAGALSGTDSGIVVVGNRIEGYCVAAQCGPLGDVLTAMPGSSLTEIGTWVDGPLSCYTVGAPDGEGFTGFDHLRLAGVGTLMAVALVRGDEQLGFLVVADRATRMHSTDQVEQLELLASLVSSTLVNARHLHTLTELARRDPLTGLGHHVAFSECLHATRGHHGALAVLSIDVDHFKAINDSHGHERGNRVLCDLANAMNDAIRAADRLFRTGGDEFAAVLAVDSEDEALQVAARLERAARRAGVTVSIGVAFTGDAAIDDLYSRADAALYEAKRAGRNLTRIAG